MLEIANNMKYNVVIGKNIICFSMITETTIIAVFNKGIKILLHTVEKLFLLILHAR